MGYCTQSDLEGSITAAKVAELSKPETAAVAVPRVIADSDSEINLYNTDSWAADAKRACSVALSIEGLFGRHGTGKIPQVHKERAALWRLRLGQAGQRASRQGTWSQVAYDPILGESDRELQRLRTGI